MGILTAAEPAIIVCTRDRAKATAFYRDVLGLELDHEDDLAAVFKTGGVTLRVSHVPNFSPGEHTILGFRVPDVEAAVKALRAKGVAFVVFPHFRQDEFGMLTLPGEKARVAWLKDPDGNLLSVTDV